MGSRAVVVALAVVLLAGCSAVGGGVSNGTSTTTTVAEETATGELELPPGISASGVDDGRQVLLNHRGQVTGDSYTVIFERTVNGTTTKSTIKVDPSASIVLSRFEQSGTDGSHVIYQDNTTQYVKKSLGVNTTHFVVENESFSTPITVGKLQSFVYMLEQSDCSNPRTVQVGEDPAVQYDIVGFRGQDIANGSLTVTETGVITEFDLTLEMENKTYVYEYTVTDRGSTTITEPGWTEAAAASAMNGSSEAEDSGETA